MSSEEVILFVTNGDGTATCAWCEEIFDATLAVPDGDLDPICPGCAAVAEEESLEMTRDEYIEESKNLHPELSDHEHEANYQNFDKWRNDELEKRGKAIG